MTVQNTRLGIWLMVLTTFIFALQDGISRHLAGEYNVFMVVMIRYWFFAAFVMTIAARKAGGLRSAAATVQPLMQGFACYPLLIAALSGPVLGERVGWRRWVAIAVGFVGVTIILEPGFGVFQPAAIIPFIAALMFALYGLLTRFVARRDTAATSFFWTGTVGAVAMTAVGTWFWEAMSGPDWAWMGALCITGAAGHYTLIKCYEVAEASAVQPFAYLQLAFASTLGILVFSETIRPNVALGAALIVGAGLFTLWRQRQKG